MNLQEKLALIEEVLDVETGSLTPETLLAEVDEWDSIAALSLIVMLDEKFEKTVSGAQIKALELRYGICVQKYVIMPNHIHLLLTIDRAEQSPAPTVKLQNSDRI